MIQVVDGEYRHDDLLTDERCKAEPHDDLTETPKKRPRRVRKVAAPVEIKDVVPITIPEELGADVDPVTGWDNAGPIIRVSMVDAVMCQYSKQLYGHKDWLKEKNRTRCNCLRCGERRGKAYE